MNLIMEHKYQSLNKKNMNRDCIIYLTSELELNNLELELNSNFNNCEIELEFILLKNSDFDSLKQIEFPDGFLHFKYVLEIIFLNDEIENSKIISKVNEILEYLWKSNISAIASCDYENLLINKGGYKSLLIPWPN